MYITSKIYSKVCVKCVISWSQTIGSTQLAYRVTLNQTIRTAIEHQNRSESFAHSRSNGLSDSAFPNNTASCVSYVSLKLVEILVGGDLLALNGAWNRQGIHGQSQMFFATRTTCSDAMTYSSNRNSFDCLPWRLVARSGRFSGTCQGSLLPTHQPQRR